MNQQQNRTDMIERAIDKEVTGGLSIQGVGGGLAMQPQNMTEVMEFAKMMATGGSIIRSVFRGNPGACLAITMQALRWGMDPFAVANKAYLVKGKGGEESMGYEAQLVQAVVTERAPLEKRLRTHYEGKDQERQCIVTGYLKGEAEPFVYESPMLKDIDVQNSPLWKSDPDQQLSYYSVRAWARRHVPEVLLGVYTEDEVRAQSDYLGPDNAKVIGGDRPTRDEYTEDEDGPKDAVELDEFDQISPVGEVVGCRQPEPFLEWFFWALINLPEDQVPDHIRNNIETAAFIASNGLAEDVTLRGIYVRLANDGWPPDRYEEKASKKEVSEDDAPAAPDQAAMDLAEDEPTGEEQEPWRKVFDDAMHAFTNVDNLGSLELLWPVYEGHLEAMPDDKAEELRGFYNARKLAYEKAASKGKANAGS